MKTSYPNSVAATIGVLLAFCWLTPLVDAGQKKETTYSKSPAVTQSSQQQGRKTPSVIDIESLKRNTDVFLQGLSRHRPRIGEASGPYIGRVFEAIGWEPDETMRRRQLLPSVSVIRRAQNNVERLSELGISPSINLVSAFRPIVAARPTRPPGGFDVIASSRIGIADDILRAAFDLGTIEREVGTEEEAGDLAALLTPAVETTLGDREWAANSLVLADPPFIEGPEATGESFKIVLPLTISGILRSPDGAETPLDLRLDAIVPMRLVATVIGGAIRISGEPDRTSVEAATVLSISEDQPLRPLTTNESSRLKAAGILADFQFKNAVSGKIGPFRLSPDMDLPGEDTGLRIAGLAAHVVPDANGDEVVVGVVLQGQSKPPHSVEMGSLPEGLLRPSDPSSRRAAALIDVHAVQVVLDELLANDGLNTGSIRIRSAEASFAVSDGMPEFIIDMEGTAVDGCDSITGLVALDVDFKVRAHLRISADADRVKLTLELEGEDKDNLDFGLCLFAIGGLDFIIAPTGVLARLAMYIEGKINDGPDSPATKTVGSLALPFQIGHIPSTEHLAEVTVADFYHGTRSLTAVGNIAVREDQIGSYVYLRTSAAPEGAVAEVVDQDAPLPPGDIPPVAVDPEQFLDSVISEDPPILTRIDDVLAQSGIRPNEIVQVRLTPGSLITVDGSIKVRGTLFEPEMGGIPPGGFSPFDGSDRDILGGRPRRPGPHKPVVTTQISMRELEPDLYFRVVVAGRRAVADSRAPLSGIPIKLNFQKGNLGSPHSPIQIPPIQVLRFSRQVFEIR